MFAAAPFRLKNISRNGAPPRSGTGTELPKFLRGFGNEITPETEFPPETETDNPAKAQRRSGSKIFAGLSVSVSGGNSVSGVISFPKPRRNFGSSVPVT